MSQQIWWATPRSLVAKSRAEVPLELPALLTVQTGANEPGYATLRAIKQAKAAPFDTVAPAELGLDDAELEKLVGSGAVAVFDGG